MGLGVRPEPDASRLRPARIGVDKQNYSPHNGLMHQDRGAGHTCVELVIPAEAGIPPAAQDAVAISLQDHGNSVASPWQSRGEFVGRTWDRQL